MDGALKLESKVFDSATNSWKIAADVIPYLELAPKEPPAAQPKAQPKAQKDWQPPPRPSELRNIHVVDLNSEATGGGVDYFALISDRKREVEKARAAARVQTARELEEEQRKRAGAAPRQSSGSARRAEPERSAPTAPSAGAKPPTGPRPSEGDGIISAEVLPQSGKILAFVRKASTALQTHRTAVGTAAALAFVFVGTYGVVRTLSDRKGREPATLESAAKTPAAQKQRATVPYSRAEDTLGSGKNRVNRDAGGVSYRNTAPNISRVVPAMPDSAPSPTNTEPPREPAQFYSSGDNAQPIGQPPAAVNPAVMPPGTDPNAGAVMPPGYVQPLDPQGDPTRTPTSDPSMPYDANR